MFQMSQLSVEKHDGHIKKYHRNTFANKTLHTYTVANLY